MKVACLCSQAYRYFLNTYLPMGQMTLCAHNIVGPIMSRPRTARRGRHVKSCISLSLSKYSIMHYIQTNIINCSNLALQTRRAEWCVSHCLHDKNKITTLSRIAWNVYTVCPIRYVHHWDLLKYKIQQRKWAMYSCPIDQDEQTAGREIRRCSLR